MTKKQIIDDLILRVTKGAPSDDLELSPRQVAFWFDLIANEVVPKFLWSRMSKNQSISSVLIHIDDNLEPVIEDVVMLDEYDDRVYIEPTKKIMDLPRDRGVLRVITEEGQKLDRVPIERLDTLNALPFSKPSRDNMLYSKVNDKLYIHGLSPKSVENIEFSVTYIPAINIYDLEDNDELDLPEEVLNLISDALEDRARKQMLAAPDIENDAEDDNIVAG